MTLSRTARILVAILLLAAAAFFWVNFFYRDGLTPLSVDVPGLPGADATGTPSTVATATPEADAPAAAGATPDADATVADPAAAQVEQVAPSADAPVVVPLPEVVTRDVSIADLPFLVTEPPASPTQADAQAEATQATARAASGQRISVNPFSPIFIQAQAPAATTPPSAQPAVTTVTEVPIPAQPQAAGSMAGSSASSVRPANAPAPRPLAPPAPRADGLPRQLPGGTPFATTPDLLREARTVPEITSVELGGLASVREPGAESDMALAPVGVAGDLLATDAPVDPIGPLARVESAPIVEPVVSAPLAAGVDPLSRYLRDNNVVFTGSVRGPVSVGVFRSSKSQTPLVVSLGQTLPDTEIVLTDLTGMKAEFKLADSTQVLSLDLRR